MSLAKQQEWGVTTDADLDEYKRIWKETDPILLTVTFVVSLLHMFFEWMALKSDIQFWRAKESVEGISVRSLYVEVVMQVVIQLYFMDNQTSLLVMIPHLLSIPLTLWKISQAVRVEKSESFPYFKLAHKASYANSATKEFDRQAMTYMSYALYPCLAVYSVYSFMYNQHRSTYSYVLNTLVGAIYLFGFIEMTPQLYINYKLKSVDHLPAKTFVYKFLNTIIDDLFSFIITMPAMHRVSCFRDDLIFVIYLYQRWIYRNNKKRNTDDDSTTDGKEKKE